MGVVYRATELSLGRPVALKLLAPIAPATSSSASASSASGGWPPRSTTRSWRFPSMRRASTDGSLYLVMRYVAGPTCTRCCASRAGSTRRGRPSSWRSSPRRSTPRTRPGSCTATSKPANVLLAGDHAYLSDFGLTRLAGSDTSLTGSGQWIGTVEYCSPEQLRGGRTDRARRRLLARLRAVRRAHRRAAVRPGNRDVDHARPSARPAADAVRAGRAARVRPRDRARAREAAGGPLSLDRRPRARRAGRRPRRGRDRVRAQRGDRLGGAREERQRRRDRGAADRRRRR